MVILRDPAMRNIAQTGEIRKEYERELSKIKQERAEQDLASQKLIKEILAQDERELAAFRVANKENKPTNTAHSSQSIRLPLPQRSSSIDSITGEFSRYFKPIARYPRTPPRMNDKGKGYPDTIKVTPCPQTVKRLDFASSCSPPDSTQVLGEPSDSTNLTGSTNIASTSKAASKGDTSDHTFLLPLHTIADEQSNDGMSMVSASTDTSKSNSRLRIGTSSPIIPTMRPGTYSSRSSHNLSDTISYRSDASSPEVKRSKKKVVSKRVKKNGYLNSKSSKVNGKTTNGVRVTRSRAHSSASSSSNGRRSARYSNGAEASTYSNGTRCNSATQSGNTVKSSNGTKATSKSATTTRCNILNNSAHATSPAENGTALTNGHSSGQPAFTDPDETYAKKLQHMYDVEQRYHLNGLRVSGSGNEYNTRKRARRGTS